MYKYSECFSNLAGLLFEVFNTAAFSSVISPPKKAVLLNFRIILFILMCSLFTLQAFSLMHPAGCYYAVISIEASKDQSSPPLPEQSAL